MDRNKSNFTEMTREEMVETDGGCLSALFSPIFSVFSGLTGGLGSLAGGLLGGGSSSQQKTTQSGSTTTGQSSGGGLLSSIFGGLGSLFGR